MSPKQMDPISYTSQAAVVCQCLGQTSEQSDVQTRIDVAITCSMSSVREDTHQGSLGKRRNLSVHLYSINKSTGLDRSKIYP